jgi:hypothetical protein
MLVHEPKRLDLQDLPIVELTAKLLHYKRGVTTHPDPEFMFSQRPEEGTQLQEYLDTKGASFTKKGVPIPPTVLLHTTPMED